MKYKRLCFKTLLKYCTINLSEEINHLFFILKQLSDKLTSIIIVNHNTGNLLLECVESIYKTEKFHFEIIIVDNVSTDNSHILCKERFPEIKLIENSNNVGYCEGNNIGIKEASGYFVVILNPDTRVEPFWLIELIKEYDKYGDALYQPKILTLKNPTIINTAGNMIHPFGFSFSRGQGDIDKGQFNEHQEIGSASGACLFTTINILKSINMLDPFLFVYHDDTDLNWKAAHLGIKSYYVPSSIIYHLGGYYYKWSQRKFFLLERNRHYLLLTHYSRKTFYKMLPALIFVDLMVLLYYLSKGMFKIKLKAYLDIIKNRKYIKNIYNELENKKLICDKEIIKKWPDEIFIPHGIGGTVLNRIFNVMILFLCKSTRRFL